MNLIDIDKLKGDGWVLEKHGYANTHIATKPLADVPVVLDTDKFVEYLDTVIEQFKEHNNHVGCLMVNGIKHKFLKTIGEINKSEIKPGYCTCRCD